MAISIPREASIAYKTLDPEMTAHPQCEHPSGLLNHYATFRREPYLSSFPPVPGFGHMAWDYAVYGRDPYYQALLSFHTARGFASPSAGYLPRTFKSLYTDEEKPSQSYIGLIGQAIMSSHDKKMVLSDIYKWILTHYAYFRNKGPGWKNSVRHNLSLNDCFIKAGRSPNGKGNYWAINPDNYDDFRKGDFRRRRAQRRVRKPAEKITPNLDEGPGHLVPCSENSPRHEALQENTSRLPGMKDDGKVRTFDVENLLRSEKQKC